MDWLILVISGIVIGMVVAAPLGPVNLICIRRTLAYGRTNGFLSGTGSALGDGVFALVVAFGLTAIASLIQDYAQILQLIGGLILVAMGVRTYYTGPGAWRKAEGRVPAKLESDYLGGGLGGTISSTFLLTVTNPATLLAFIGIFSSHGKVLTEDATYGSAAILVGAVVLGSLLWWLSLTQLIGLFRGEVTGNHISLINRISGLVIGAFGLVVLGRLVWRLIFN
jgi:threonine/homoserine/homoserine lactone efflux protein